MDVQAQDRAHRIGQTKPVLIFRLVSAHTIETKIMQRAAEKKKLEALVIAKGQNFSTRPQYSTLSSLRAYRKVQAACNCCYTRQARNNGRNGYVTAEA